jgi:hypothetical protein
MSRKVTSVRIDHARGRVTARAQSKSLRGTGFTVRGVVVDGDHKGNEQIKRALAEALSQLFPERT